MDFLKNYFSKLQEILKEKSILHFVLLTVSIAFLFLDITATTKWLVVLFVLTFIFQSLILRRKCYPLYFLRVLIVILLGFQLASIVKISTGEKVVLEEKGVIYKQDNLLSWLLMPNVHDAWSWKLVGKDTIVKVCISTDSFSRRIPDDAFMKEYTMNQNHPDRHAVFLGCSYTEGAGLNYFSTFPFMFEQLNPDYKSYNYGVSGFGPHQIALLFDKRVNTINEEAIPEERGFALYTYIDDHLNRVYGSSYYLRLPSWTPSLPNVYIENDSLVIKKWSITQLAYAKLFKELALFRKFDIHFGYGYPFEESFYKRFAEIINYTAKKYWEFKPDNYFYVGIYPGRHSVDLNWIQYLDERIVVLKVTPPSDYYNI